MEETNPSPTWPHECPIAGGEATVTVQWGGLLAESPWLWTCHNCGMQGGRGHGYEPTARPVGPREAALARIINDEARMMQFSETIKNGGVVRLGGVTQGGKRRFLEALKEISEKTAAPSVTE